MVFIVALPERIGPRPLARPNLTQGFEHGSGDIRLGVVEVKVDDVAARGGERLEVPERLRALEH